MGLLAKTKCYLVGHMQYADGESWRKHVKDELSKLEIICLDPYHKPFISDLDEGNESRASRLARLANGDLESIHKEMKMIRAQDLCLVDKSDFVIAHIIPEVASWGSAEELSLCSRILRPTFISVGDIRKTPLWLLGSFSVKCFYNSVDEIIQIIKDIDSGKKEIDSRKWKLLKYTNR